MTLWCQSKFYCIGVNERKNTLWTRTSKYLNLDTIAALQSFQIEKNNRVITDYLDINSKMNTYHFEYCPKCGCYHPRLVKSSFANSGKNILHFTECGKRFVIDRGQLNLPFILTKTNPKGINLFWIH